MNAWKVLQVFSEIVDAFRNLPLTLIILSLFKNIHDGNNLLDFSIY